MAYLPMISGGGCDLTGTLIWTNPTPSTNITANKQLVASTDIQDYDYIRVVWCYSTTALNTMSEMIVNKADWASQTPSSAIAKTGTICARESGSGGRTFYRGLWLNNPSLGDGIWIDGNCRQVGGTTIANNMCIPLYIYGIKA